MSLVCSKITYPGGQIIIHSHGTPRKAQFVSLDGIAFLVCKLCVFLGNRDTLLMRLFAQAGMGQNIMLEPGNGPHSQYRAPSYRIEGGICFMSGLIVRHWGFGHGRIGRVHHPCVPMQRQIFFLNGAGSLARIEVRSP